jgi:hypothetical protein
MNSILPIAERFERLLRTVDINGFDSIGPKLEQAGTVIP